MATVVSLQTSLVDGLGAVDNVSPDCHQDNQDGRGMSLAFSVVTNMVVFVASGIWCGCTLSNSSAIIGQTLTPTGPGGDCSSGCLFELIVWFANAPVARANLSSANSVSCRFPVSTRNVKFQHDSRLPVPSTTNEQCSGSWPVLLCICICLVFVIKSFWC